MAARTQMVLSLLFAVGTPLGSARPDRRTHPTSTPTASWSRARFWMSRHNGVSP